MGLELVVSGFFLPSLVIAGGQFVGPGVGWVQDRGEQDDQFAGAVAVPVGYVVLDHPGQVGDGKAVFVEGVGDGGDVVQVRACQGGGQQPFAPGAPDGRSDQHGQVGPVAEDPHDGQVELAGGTPQQRRPGGLGAVPGGPGVEVAVGGEQL